MFLLVLLVRDDRIELLRQDDNKAHLLRNWVQVLPADTLRFMLKLAHQILPIGGQDDLYLSDSVPLLLEQWKLVPVTLRHMIQEEMLVFDNNIKTPSDHRLVVLET